MPLAEFLRTQRKPNKIFSIFLMLFLSRLNTMSWWSGIAASADLISVGLLDLGIIAALK
jgi:hypothetical protein